VVPPPRLSCPKCGRAGQYRKQNLIERYGAAARAMSAFTSKPDIRNCERYVRYGPKADIVWALKPPRIQCALGGITVGAEGTI
jgi:hypothetical protein